MPATTNESVQTDILVLGGGGAGRRAAIAAARAGASVVLVHWARGASPYLLGCNAVLGDAVCDSVTVHAEDTVRGGCGINDRGLVEVLVGGAAGAIGDLAAVGVPFATDGGHFRRRHLSGNTHPRSVFVPDGTGVTIMKALEAGCDLTGVRTLTACKAVGLLTDGGEVVGALLVDRQGVPFTVRARAVVLALGGLGRLFADTTYPSDVAADGYALAARAGARLIDMEFVQFEPTVTVFPPECAGMEMPTAMLGDGAHLLNASGERFMLRHNPEGGERGVEKAKLALLIRREIDEGRGFPDDTVAFDATVLPASVLEGYVNHRRRLLGAGVDPAVTCPRVRPAAHSQMGGVAIDRNGWTGVPNLFAGGEIVGGVHGASRLAGNGGTDILVFGAVAGAAAAAVASRGSGTRRDWPRIEASFVATFRDSQEGCVGGPRPAEIKDTVRSLMSRHVGLHRHGVGLTDALRTLDGLDQVIRAGLSGGDAVAAIEAANMVLSARMVALSASTRTESRGAHQRRDFPRRDDEPWLCHVSCRLGGNGTLAIERTPIGYE